MQTDCVMLTLYCKQFLIHFFEGDMMTEPENTPNDVNNPNANNLEINIPSSTNEVSETRYEMTKGPLDPNV